MDLLSHEKYIQKCLLYKFDKKLDLVMKQYFDMMFRNQDKDQNSNKLSKAELIAEIEALEFMNFKYRTSLLSSNGDITQNQLILNEQNQKIAEMKAQIKMLQERLSKAQVARKNKRFFNKIGEQIQKYDKKTDFEEKMEKIEKQIQQLQKRYSKEIDNYEKKERYLKASISSLNAFLAEIQREQLQQREEVQEKSIMVQAMEDEGQIQ